MERPQLILPRSSQAYDREMVRDYHTASFSRNDAVDMVWYLARSAIIATGREDDLAPWTMCHP